MFPKNNGRSLKWGWIEVFCGSMFSGKTKGLIRCLKRSERGNKRSGFVNQILPDILPTCMVFAHIVAICIRWIASDGS